MAKQQRVILIIGAFFLVIMPMLLFVMLKISDSNLASKDSGAIYGGRLEKDYISSGYLVSYISDTQADICGLVKIDKDLAISAAHCFSSTDRVYLSADPTEPQFSFSKDPVEVFKNASWDGKKPSNDIAILNYNNQTNGNYKFANVSVPKEGCNYRVVGYGRTETDSANIGLNRTKKSAGVCITNLSNDLVTLKGNGGGICLGDSGSPIYEEGTENVVAIISSIIVKGDSASNPCYVGNEAVGVRVDKHMDFITEVAQSIGDNFPSSNNVGPNIIKADLTPVSSIGNTGGSSSALSSTFSAFFTPGKKVFGIEVSLITKIYFLLLAFFVIMLLRYSIFRPKHSY